MSTKQAKTVIEIAWLAGILEGEGCFSLQGFRSPTIGLTMTDEDVVNRVAVMFFGARVKPKARIGKNKLQFKVVVHGIQAVQWMLTIWPLMGQRRRAKIKECLAPWFLGPVQNKDKERCKRGHLLAGENVRVAAYGRVCRTCQAMHQKAWKAVNPPKPLSSEARDRKRSAARERYRNDPEFRARAVESHKRWRTKKLSTA